MKRLCLPLALLALASCNLAPDYFVPDAPAAPAYKEIDPNWTVAVPAAQMPRGQWWLVFQDPMLNDLEAQIQDANQDLQAAIARFENARAAVEYARASLFPVVTGNASSLRERESRNRPLIGATSPTYYGDHVVGLDATYEVDVFGRLRNAATAAEVSAEASADDLQTLNLSLHAELAADYFQLRGSEALMRLLVSTIKAYQEALDLTTQRFEGGVAGEIDVQEARAQLKAAQAALADATLARAKTEHAIALLIGRAASDFSLPESEFIGQPPAIPAGMPSLLLERRPDIAEAERDIAARNAQIGVARAAYFPVFDLTADGGYEGSKNSTVFKSASQFWSFGPSAVMTVLDFGQLDALDTEAHANYDAAVANYRQTVLGAYRDVEDSLAGVRYYDQEAADETEAVKAADRALELANDRYAGGVATFLDVVTSQAISLQDEATVVNTFVQQMNARVALIKALGGVWGDHPDPIPLPVPPADLGPIPQNPG
jgi:NodT family efflux transporter outer membrane factor (OMF) lipoprotein